MRCSSSLLPGPASEHVQGKEAQLMSSKIHNWQAACSGC